MRLFALMLFCTALVMISAEPDPKKYKAEIKDKDKQLNTTLTSDEKKFLREVEDKFGIKSDTPKEEKKKGKEEKPKIPTGRTPFPAVIAIEIVNDTDAKGAKGKRTIDANLGYGYQTNNGYTYSYFGKAGQEKGKFMVYPYSQEDIPPANSHSFEHYDHSGKPLKTSVEIQPSQAFELVPVKEEKTPYHYNKPAIEFKTPSHTSASYSSSAGQSSNTYTPHPSTLYTTYNGEQFSGLSGQFPTVMPDYLVDPSQLIKNPEYQNVGITQDHLRTHGSHLEQKVVPVLVLRIPSSSLTNPTAELYANLPNNYPLSNSLNNLNLQELVNQYFKKMGYNFAPQVMAYHGSGHQSSQAESHSHSQGHGQRPQYEPQHYAHPYVQPSYTQSHHSGVQYSAVQPVMAKYPSSYVRQHYRTMPKGYSLYKQPALPQKYEYRYHYSNPHSAVSSQKFYLPSSHYQQQTEHVPSAEVQDVQQASLEHGAGGHDGNTQVQYVEQSHVSAGYETAVSPAADYGAPQQQTVVEYETSNSVAPEYGTPKAQSVEAVQAAYQTAGTPAPEYEPSQETAASPGPQEYYSPSHEQQDTQSAYPAQSSQSYESQADLGGHQNYVYQQQEQYSNDQSSDGHQDSNGHQDFVISENYPSKDHTIATVLPTHYKTGTQQSSGPIQSVAYVTPTPYSSKYQMPYKVMVPQTYLHHATTERVAYVNSHPMPASYSQHQDYNPEAEYTVGLHYVPPVGKQKPPPYPRNYHSHPKRMAKPENRQESSSSSFSKNKNDRNEKKRLS
ncbi:unnamed protein product [Chrysodeixis includens]|uniref:Adhesive plaque matrix protein-like n=1 Tax=Chrysodeixis includens TaxID=689277 RepID=A0A9N8KTU9_CHRIL|nr:unnamed protein product [Chrysodeixis includens]